jgi:beta-phosphoglucomutase-like phosphatase (HAD superfamily)
MSCRALIFDFNGTLSDDEPIMYRCFAELFADEGKPLSQADYVEVLAGHTDEEMIRRWLGDRPDVDALVARRVARYTELSSDGSTISQSARDAVWYAAQRVPLAIVSGAAAAEIVPVVAAAGLAEAFVAIVASDHVADGKPHPEGYLAALDLLAAARGPIAPDEVVVFEDTEAGVASAKAAGMRCVAIVGTMSADRLSEAEALADGIDVELIEALLA